MLLSYHLALIDFIWFWRSQLTNPLLFFLVFFGLEKMRYCYCCCCYLLLLLFFAHPFTIFPSINFICVQFKMPTAQSMCTHRIVCLYAKPFILVEFRRHTHTLTIVQFNPVDCHSFSQTIQNHEFAFIRGWKNNYRCWLMRNEGFFCSNTDSLVFLFWWALQCDVSAALLLVLLLNSVSNEVPRFFTVHLVAQSGIHRFTICHFYYTVSILPDCCCWCWCRYCLVLALSHPHSNFETTMDFV